MTVNADGMEIAQYHHFHLNVVDPAETIRFYTELMGAVKIRYRGVADALFTERSFILFTKVDKPAPLPGPNCILTHAGWDGVDGPNQYEWLKSRGVRFQTPPTPHEGAHFMYFWGPDNELLEIFTGGKSYRFNHFHHICADIHSATAWYRDNLGVRVGRPPESKPPMNSMHSGNMNIIFHPKAPLAEGQEFESTEGTVIDHIAFSFRDIDAAYERMEKNGVEIVRPIEEDDAFGHRSFFVYGPEKVLVEIVQDKPIPEGIWE